MFTLFALEASEPLTKRLYLDESGNTAKSNYPPVRDFTSHAYPINTITDMYHAVVDASGKGWCLVKGALNKELFNESRAKSTNPDGTTHFLCLDVDGLTGFKDVADFMDKHPDLSDVSYIVQYSSSYGLPATKGIHAHIFILLSHEYHATYLKGWLTKQNVNGDILAGAILNQLTLNRTQSVLHYPIDITACQNDKLLYIAPPVIDKGVKYKMPKDGFIHFVSKKIHALPIERLEHGTPELQKTEARKVFNELRKKAGLDTVTGRTKVVDGLTVEPECGEFQITGIRSERGYVYFNMNHGDSWSWWHPVDNHKFIHCFKDDRIYLSSRILPRYFKDCEQRRKDVNQTATDDGETLLCFRDIRTAEYFNGTWTPETQTLELYHANNEKQLSDYLMQRGRELGDFIPQWTVDFSPQSAIICDPAQMYLNTYVPSPYMLAERSPSRSMALCPTIERVILSAVSGGVYNEVTEHFLNWLAVIFQYKVKTRTAWVLHGTQGTGKGIIANLILTPLLGARYVQQRRMSELEEKFTGWMEEALIAVIDEVQVSSSKRKELISGDMKNFITEPRCTIRHMNRIAYLANSYVNFLLFSNMDDPIQMDGTDRRFNSGDYQHTKLVFTSRDKYLISQELPHFMDYIMQREADADRAGEIVENKARSDIITANKNSIDLLAEALVQGDLTPFIDALPDIKLLAEMAGADTATGLQYSRIILRELSLLSNLPAAAPNGFFTVESRLSRDELNVIFEYCIGGMQKMGKIKFTRLLKHKQLELKRIRFGDRMDTGIYVVWIASREWVETNRIPEPQKVVPLRRARG